jgi:hypothetical protein
MILLDSNNITELLNRQIEIFRELIDIIGTIYIFLIYIIIFVVL